MSGRLATTWRPLWVGALALTVLPFALQAVGLTWDTSAVVVILCIAAMGLNLLVGTTGLVSFGHSVWFGIGGYAGAISQKHWMPGQILLPLLFAVVFTSLLALVVGFLILRRRGVYFSLLTLALSALTYAIAFRWTALTGGEGGLGGVERSPAGSTTTSPSTSSPRWSAGACCSCCCAWCAHRSATCWWRSARTSSAPPSRATTPTATSSAPSCCRPRSPHCPARCWSFTTGWPRPSRPPWPSAASCWRWSSSAACAASSGRRWACCSTCCSASCSRSGPTTGCSGSA
jgi:hypothetical protein